MSSLTDFDYQPHRIVSAAVAFQKGLYHLFLLKSDRQTDSYEQLIRSYQCVFQLGITLVLLDDAFSLNALLRKTGLSAPLKARCCDPKNPSRDEIDPACVVTHSAFQRWPGFQTTHPLARIGAETLDLYSRTVDVRHNLLYRPFLLDGTKPHFTFGPFWEDCTLRALIDQAPSWQDIEAAHKNFADAIWAWRNLDRDSQVPPDFIIALFTPYIDRHGAHRTETALLRYARMLSGNNQPLLAGLAGYRNKLIDQDKHAEKSGIGLPPEWSVGEI